jgi:trans-aconitate methyltransferase
MEAASPIIHIWEAEEYHNHSSAQFQAAIQLLKNIELKGNEQILDVGCGDGKITASIASRVPEGSVLGIDLSSEMIGFARNFFSSDRYFNLRFDVLDAQKLDYREQFDILFSSFALQWLPDLDSFLKRAYTSLKPSGHLVITIPLGISSALEEAIDEIVSLSEWAPYYYQFSPNWHFITDGKFEQLLISNHFQSNHFAVMIQEVVFSSRESFEKYVIQWFSYLHPLPEPLKMVFFKQVIDRYLEIEPILKNNEVVFCFPRLDIIAKKN